tara:strand:- start:886 stop:1095 length:210 start_codon:yes stop_codon:yes gene_type:complete
MGNCETQEILSVRINNPTNYYTKVDGEILVKIINSAMSRSDIIERFHTVLPLAFVAGGLLGITLTLFII